MIATADAKAEQATFGATMGRLWRDTGGEALPDAQALAARVAQQASQLARMGCTARIIQELVTEAAAEGRSVLAATWMRPSPRRSSRCPE